MYGVPQGDLDGLVGLRCEVFWGAPHSVWFPAAIAAFDPGTGGIEVVYDDDGLSARVRPGFGAPLRLLFGGEWVGRRLEVEWTADRWYEAEVVGQNGDGSHRLRYPSDGIVEDAMLWERPFRAVRRGGADAAGRGATRGERRDRYAGTLRVRDADEREGARGGDDDAENADAGER